MPHKKKAMRADPPNAGMTLIEVLTFATVSVLILVSVVETFRVSMKNTKSYSLGSDATQTMNNVTTLLSTTQQCTVAAGGQPFDPNQNVNPIVVSAPLSAQLAPLIITPDYLSVKNMFFQKLANSPIPPGPFPDPNNPQDYRWRFEATLNISLNNSAVTTNTNSSGVTTPGVALGASGLTRQSQVPFVVIIHQTSATGSPPVGGTWTIAKCGALIPQTVQVNTAQCKPIHRTPVNNAPAQSGCDPGYYMTAISTLQENGDQYTHRYCDGKGCSADIPLCPPGCSWREPKPTVNNFEYVCCPLAYPDGSTSGS
jgi:hypothetical protein